jgi:hypothetical protein
MTTTGGLHRPATNGPAAFGDLPVIQTLGLIGKIGLLLPDGFGVLASRHLESGDAGQELFLLTVPQLVQTLFDPCFGVVFAIEGFAQFPQMLAGVVKVQ